MSVERIWKNLWVWVHLHRGLDACEKWGPVLRRGAADAVMCGKCDIVPGGHNLWLDVVEGA